MMGLPPDVLGPAPGGLDMPMEPDQGGQPIDPMILALQSGGADVTEGEDGSMTFDLGPMLDAQAAMQHDANLAGFMDDEDLNRIAADLLDAFDADKASREEWEQSYVDGLRLLGIKIEKREDPWPDACGITVPLLLEAAIRFQGRTITELFPSSGPVKTSIIGKITPEKQAQAERVKTYLNYHLTEVDRGYFADLDQMLFMLPVSGQTFRKVWYDPLEGCTTSRWLRGEDVVHSYAVDVNKAPRVSHVMRLTPNDVRRLQVAGLYLDTPLVPPSVGADDEPIIQAKDELEGKEPNIAGQHDERHTLLEIHCELDLPGFEDQTDRRDPESGATISEPTGIALPYVVTIDRDSRRVLAIYRNWREDDRLRKKRTYFVGYGYIPGPGSYALGLVHIIGGLSAGATSILRQLVDAGELATLPAGFRAKGLRVKDNDVPLAPGEWREVDAPGIDLTKALVPLPYKGGDATLLQMFGQIVEMAQRLASTSDEVIGDIPPGAPVGTTLAALEQALKPLSAIHKRLHEAQKQEFALIAQNIADHLPVEGYPYEVAGGEAVIMATDFDKRVDVLPVSDPNTTSKPQRIAKAQAIKQLAQEGQQLGVNHDMRQVWLDMYAAIGVEEPDRLMPPPPPPPEPISADPASENVLVLGGQAIQATPGQPHMEHVAVHLSLLGLPGYSSTPAGQSIITHIFQHVALMARDAVNAMIAQKFAEMQRQMPAPMAGMMPGGPASQPASQPGGGMPGQPPGIGALPPPAPPQPPQPPRLPEPGQPYPPELEPFKSQIEAELAKQQAQLSQQVTAQLVQVMGQAAMTGQDPITQIEMAKIRQREEADRRKLEAQTTTEAARLAEAGRQAEMDAELEREKIEAQERMNTQDNGTALTIAAARNSAASGTGRPPALNPDPNYHPTLSRRD